MYGFVGSVNFKNNISTNTDFIKKMNITKENYYINNVIFLAQKTQNKHMIEKFNDNEFVIVYNGNIYNYDALKKDLIENGFSFNATSDAELILKAYIHYGHDIVYHLNGAFSFAIWNNKEHELFLARDHFGIKPLFYTICNNNLLFSSEIKTLFEFPEVQKILDSQSISELFGIGPAHTPGTTVFKNIFEIKPAHFAIYNNDGLHIKRYWKLNSKEHTDSLGKTCEKIKFLLTDSITKQLTSEKPLCTFLSGGLDSSIITKVVANHFKEEGLCALDTYSVDYVDNDKNFIKSDFQPNSDNYYIDLINKNLYTNHHKIVIDTPELAETLEDAMIARDMPGMADIDSSLLLFCKNVKKEKSVALTGECADEIFGGYPWFFRDDALKSNTFPWSIALEERQKLLHPDIGSKIHLKEYVNFRYTESLKEVELLDSDTKETCEKRKISYLTLNWFMQTLLDRSERMARYSGFELRVPFCDYRLAEYVWNIPWEMKALNGREKGLLRYVCKDFLPAEIVDRKKSPYPKTHNPTYLKTVKTMLTKIMEKNDAPINNLLNRNYILEILKSNGESFSRPWFGQLMTRTSTYGLFVPSKYVA